MEEKRFTADPADTDAGKGAAYADPNRATALGTEGSAASSADVVDTNAEETYWRDNYVNSPYVEKGTSFIEYKPAYRYGADAHRRLAGKSFEDVEPELAKDWDSFKGTSSLTWDKAKHAARDAWDKVSNAIERVIPGDSDGDGR